MTDRPYTDDDLRVEAARQHYTATTDPDFMGIGERMDGSPIESTCFDASGERQAPGLTWDQLDGTQFGEVQRAVDDLLGKAADVSEWAIGLGADGLEPEEHAITLRGDERPIVRVHFAFAPELSDAAREAFVVGIGETAASGMHLAASGD
ncbi:hypothetical protein [Streptomyces spinosirectus]